MIAAEALTAADRLDEADERLASAADALDPRVAPAAWGEYLRLRGTLQARRDSAAEAYHDFAQSAALLDLLGERYQAALSHLAIGRLVAVTGARSVAERHLDKAFTVFEQLGAERDLVDTQAAQLLLTSIGTGQNVISAPDADDAIVRRIVDAAALPDLLGRETVLALLETAAGDCSVLYVELAGGDVRIVAAAGCEGDAARVLARLRRPRIGVRTRHRGDRVARARSRGAAIRSRRLAPAHRPSGHAPPADDCGGRPAGLRAVRCARSVARRDRSGRRSIARAAAAGLPVGERRDDAGRRADPATAGT